jgi:membrane-bound lytic murein transglycosylase D
MGLNEFDKYNPMFDKNISTIGHYELKLPADKMELFTNNKYAILNECVNLMLK